MKTLLLDCETAPLTVYCWGLREQDISLDQIIDSSYVLCWSAKWLDRPEVMFERTRKQRGSSKGMITRIHRLLSEADTVITYNGIKFDLPTLNKEFVLHGLSQPAPYTNLDLYKIAKHKFRFPSNKLDHLATELGIGNKIKHDGFLMWVRCMEMDPTAWKKMTEYNIQDVLILEKLYYRLLPWIKTQTNQSLHNDGLVCPTCGVAEHQKRGYYYSQRGKFQRYVCRPYGHWFRGTKNLLPKGFKVVTI